MTALPSKLGCRRVALWCLVAAAISGDALRAAEPPAAGPVAFEKHDGQLDVTIGGKPFATYVWQDDAITRPYFAHVRAPGGTQVTRNHPPVAGQDLPDHATFHPGIWMAFGDINGSDFWRLKAPVKFVEFTAEPQGGVDCGSFAVRNSYRDQRDPKHEVCREDFRCSIRVVREGYLLSWDSTFTGDKKFAFGDQEEMGIGFRTATALRVEQKSKDAPGLPPGHGELLDAEGRHNEDEIWGNSAAWCDYSGEVDGRRVGSTILCHPQNLRPSWFHAREYGLLVANLFGRAAFGKGEPSKITVKPGKSLRLRYGVLTHAGPPESQVDLPAAYREYVELAK